MKVYGSVQGVFFRIHTQAKARELGLTGWVRNEDDGSVAVIAEGEEGGLKEFLGWLEGGGPEFAKVERLSVEWREGDRELNTFEIRY